MKQKIIITISAIIMLLLLNQVYYLSHLQFKCTDKIEQGQDLNWYEKFSALQTHFNIGLFGRVVEPHTANVCLMKQFHIKEDSTLGCILLGSKFPKDDKVVNNAKQQLLSGTSNSVRLAWKSYITPISILCNNCKLSIIHHEFGDYFVFNITYDYKPGVIKIKGVTISETVFAYLETIGNLSIIKEIKLQLITRG